MINRIYSRIKDLETRGGGFIRERRIGRSLTGEAYLGTIYFNDGDSTDVIAVIYPYGGGRVISRAYQTKECTEGFNRFVDYMDSLEQHSDYKNLLILRMVITIILRATLLLLIGKTAYDISTIRPLFSLTNTAYIALDIIAMLMTNKVRALTKEI